MRKHVGSPPNVMPNFQKHIFQRTNCCLGGTCFTLTRKLSEQTLIRASTTLSGLKKMLFVWRRCYCLAAICCTFCFKFFVLGTFFCIFVSSFIRAWLCFVLVGCYCTFVRFHHLSVHICFKFFVLGWLWPAIARLSCTFLCIIVLSCIRVWLCFVLVGCYCLHVRFHHLLDIMLF